MSQCARHTAAPAASTWHRRKAGLATAAALALSVLPARADLEKLPDSLLPLPLVNGPEMNRALSGLAAQVLPSTGWIEDHRGRLIAAVTMVSAEGHFLTKASEVIRPDRCRLKFGDGTPGLPIRELRRDTSWDLLLARVETGAEARSWTPVEWDSSLPLNLGQWLCAPAWERGGEDGGEAGTRLRVGVLSAKRRSIPSQGAALGIQMAAGSSGPGVMIAGLAEESPARAAGLLAGDKLLQVAGVEVNDREQVIALVKERQPGDELRVIVEREGRQITKRVRLASRSRLIANWAGDDYANGGISIRTDGYTEVLQHDLPLNPHDMGGPVFDLNGRLVGINIARVDRITTFALPAERLRDTVARWLAAGPPAPGEDAREP